MKPLPCIILIILIFGCARPANKRENKISADTALQVIPDSTALIFNPDTSGMADEIYAVYELSTKTTAFVIGFYEDGQQKTFVDSIFDQIQSTDTIYDYSYSGQPKNASYYDTSGPYVLIKNQKFENRVKPWFDTEYYIYGTHGVAKATITNIVLGIDQCITNIYTFCIDKSKIKNIGHPLICSRKLFNLKLDSNYKNIEKNIERLYANEKADYDDSVKTYVYGNIDSLYFAYSDDFLWGRNKNRWGKNKGQSKCYFPARTIFISDKNGTVSPYWGDGLDLFGIECD